MAGIWDGKSSLHDLFVEERDRQLWQYQGNALLDAAPGKADHLTVREAFPNHKHYQRKNTEQQQLRRQKAREKGMCVRCCTRPARAARRTCARCHAVRRVRESR